MSEKVKPTKLVKSNKPLNSIKNKLILKVSLLNYSKRKAELGMKVKGEVKHSHQTKDKVIRL
jgi:hypothetical protein